MSELDILLQARLDTEETKGIVGDIKTLSERLKSNPLNLEVSIKDSDLGQLTKQIKDLEADLARLKNNTSFDGMGKGLETSFSGVNKQLSKITTTWNTATKSNFPIKEVEEYRDALGQVQKLITTRNPNDNAVKDVKLQETTNNLQIQKSLYDQIKRLNTDIFNIEKSMVGMKDSDKLELQQQVDTRKQLINEINNTIQANGLENAKLKEQVALAKELQQAKLNVAQGKSTDKDSATAYRQLVNLAKEESTLKSQMLSLEGEQLQIAQNRLNMIHSEQRELERMTNSQSGSLHNKEREAELTKTQNRLLNDQAMAQQKLIDKEKARVDMLGTKVSGNSTLQNVDLSDMNQVQQYVQSIMGANVEVSKLTEAHSRYGKGVHEVIATQKLSNNTMRQTTLMADTQTGAMYKLGEAITPLPNKLMGMVRQMGEAIIKSAQWAIAMTALYGSLRQLQEGIKIVSELDRELTLVAVTSGKTRQQVQYLGKEYAEVAQQTGKTVKEVSQVNTELVRQGLSLEESSKRMQTAMKLSAVGGFDANESLKILTSSVNALGVEADRTADVMLRAGNISASSPEEIGQAFTKTASSAKSAGVELEQLGATLATLIEVTQESPSSLGNSMKTLITRFNKVNEETGELNEDLNQVQTAFESVGIAFTDSEGQIRPMFDLLKDLNEVWGGLDKNTKAYISTQSAGKFLMCA